MSTSWEDIINQVVIPGNPQAVSDVATSWTQLFNGIREVRQAIDRGLIQLEDWKGDAGEAYRAAIGSLAKELEQLDNENSFIDHLLAEASANLNSAMQAMPLPSEMLHVIERKRADFANSSPTWPLPHDGIYNWFVLHVDPEWAKYLSLGSYFGMDLAKWLRDWIDPNAGKARDIYSKLDNQTGTTVANMPTGSGHNTLGTDTQTAYNPAHTTGSPTTGHVPGFGGGGKVPGSGTFNPHTGYGGYDPNATGDGSYRAGDYGYNPGDVSGSGLAGAGGGGFTGVGGSGGGLTGVGPGGGTGGLGLGGISPTGLAAMKGIGTPTSPYGPGGMPMMGGMPAGGARGAGSSRRPGLVGGGGGPGAGRGDDDGRGTWLQEDDDVWGTDSGAAPPLLT
jgi:hypothetical protein